MFFDRLKNINPEKIALKYESRAYSYRKILEEAESRALYFNENDKTVLLNKSKPIDNLLDFLACMYIGRKAIFLSNSAPDLSLSEYCHTFDAELSTTCLLQSNSKVIQFKADKNTIFLGVLSSGSTGQPKVIWKDYQAWFTAFPHQSTVFGISDSDSVFVLDALAYSANLNAVLHALWQGCTVFIGKLVEARFWPAQLEKEDISSIFLVPSHLDLLKNSLVKFTKVKSIVTAGEKLKQVLAQKITQNFPNALLTEYYGAAELGHVSYIQGKDLLNNPFSVGRPFPGVSIKVIDNQIFVDSSYVSPDYRNTPTVSDIGEIHSDGLLYLLGRAGRMFNRRGLNIYAQEIENIAEQHGFVNYSYLHEEKGQLHLFVEYSEPISKSELRAFLALQLSKDKMPNYIICLEKIPRLSSGKVNLKALQKIPSDEIIES